MPINQTAHYHIVNNVVDENALSLVESKTSNGTEYIYRQWDITQLDNKNWQIRSLESNLCVSRWTRTFITELQSPKLVLYAMETTKVWLTLYLNFCARLGLTVYHEGSDCDVQAQSQQWMFIKLRE